MDVDQMRELMESYGAMHLPDAAVLALAGAVRQDTLEEAAKACEALDDSECDPGCYKDKSDCAAAIRALIEPASPP